MRGLDRVVSKAGEHLARHLTRPDHQRLRPSTSSPERLAATLRRGDVLLVEGSSRISTAIKYLTQSTWSHAALCTRTPIDDAGKPTIGECLLEADVTAGVRRVPLNLYWHQHTRICRPVGLTDDEVDALVAHAEARLGHQYDLRNIVDLARYLIRMPPVPNRYRRRMLALGSGDPTRAICSSLIAQAFHSVSYPILPDIESLPSNDPDCLHCYQELLHIRHHSLFVPRDFDISPYFDIIKPTLSAGFDPHRLQWSETPP